MKEINIMHTNDIHSHMKNWFKIEKYIKNNRTKNSLLFDIGDFIDREDPLTDFYKGKMNSKLLNKSDYSAITIGNNEGLNLNHNELQTLYSEIKTPVLISNFSNQEKKEKDFFIKNKIFKMKNDLRIGVFALTFPYEESYESLGWRVEDIIPSIKKQVHFLKDKTDFILLLSHLGLPNDKMIAEKKLGVDLILGAHTHHLIKDGMKIEDTYLAASGKFGNNIGNISVSFNESNELMDINIRTEEVEKLSLDNEQKEKLFEWNKLGKDLEKNNVINEFKNIKSKNEFIDDINQSLMEYYNSDLSFISSGMVVKEFNNKIITQYDLLKALPHAVHLALFEIKGSDFKKLVKEVKSKENDLKDLVVEGMGFRGKTFGIIHFKKIPENIDDNKIYKMVSLDHYIFFKKFDNLNKLESKIDFKVILRDIVGDYYRKL